MKSTSPEEISNAKQLLLEKRLQGAKAKAKLQPAGIARASRETPLPLSFAQQRLWFLDQLTPGSPVYNIWQIVRLQGSIDVPTLQWSLAQIVERHEALRTSFSATEGEPIQVIQPVPEFRLHVIDLESIPEVEREEKLRTLAIAESKKPFDLTRDLMVRATLFRLKETDHVLAITMHHIASDAWSLGVLFKELAFLYGGKLAGKNAILPEPAIQYADYAVWQREWLQGKLLEEQLGYWKQQLTGAPEVLDLPTDKPRPAVQSFRGGDIGLELPLDLAQRLKALSRSEGVTPFMTLLAVFNVLLSKYSRQTDLLVGSPIAGRTQIETEDLIGFFVNTLVLRNDLSGDPTFRELLQRVRSVTLDAYAHQDVPLEKLVSELKPERSASHSPLFQVMFVLQNAPGKPLELPGVVATEMCVDNQTAKFDLILSVIDTPSQFCAALEYSEDLFDRTTVERMLQHFSVLLKAAVATPEARLSELPILTCAEERLLLEEWKGIRTEYPRSKSIPELFEEQAARAPNAPAVTCGSKTLSYRELNERANRLAHHLQKLDVTPGSCVAVSVERSIELIITLLGILKAGAAYVSIDPAHPAERLSSIIEDARPIVLITERKFTTVRELAGRSAVFFIEDFKHLNRESIENCRNGSTAESLAYVSFTSGSTGRPKGVCIPHRGVTRLVRNTNFISIEPADVFLQLAPVAFDASTFEIWGALLNGARLAIYPPESLSLDDLGKILEAEKVTTLWLTSGLFQQVVEEQLPRLKSLRHMLAGGDVLSLAHVKQAFAALPQCRIINGYGPTENTTFTCCHTVNQESYKGRSIPIGKPIANTEVYVLDPQLKPVPIGIPGELYTGGDGLARGYLNRPELSAEKFISNPFASGGEGKLYKTGDLVRWLSNGEIEFLGRLDDQVKIRGFRVEPGEVEAAIRSHPRVRDSVVIVESRSSSGKRLVAYFVPKADALLTPEDLRQFLQQKLPDYLQPAAFVSLSELPLNANGKVDRRALPQPDRNQSTPEWIGPRDDTESQLVQLWEEALDVPKIGIRSSFFELGGHSLLAVRLTARMEKRFGRRITVATLFQAPTIEQMARVLRGTGSNGVASSLVEIQPNGVRPPLFLVHGVGGGMFWGYTNLARHLGADQPIYALKSKAMDGAEEFGTIEEMAAHYIADLRRVQPHGPYHLGGYCFGGNVAFEMAQQLQASGEKVALLALINCGPPNSSYGQIKWTPAFTLKFLRNLGYWVRHSLHWTPEQRKEFVRWKLRSLRKRIERSRAHRNGTNGHVDVDMLVDLAPYPADQRRLWEAHIQALIKYHPRPYPGRVTLFRSPGHQLLCSFDDRYGWGELAQGGVDVKIISGAHEQILEEPHVQSVARELKSALDTAFKNRRALNGSHNGPTTGSSSRNGQEQTRAWQQALADAPEWASLSEMSSINDGQSGTAEETIQLPASVTQSLQRFAQREGASLLVTILAACGALLYRYSRQETFAIATTGSGRARISGTELIEKVRSLFVCALAVNGALTFQQAVQAVEGSFAKATKVGPMPEPFILSFLHAQPGGKSGIPLVIAEEEEQTPSGQTRFSASSTLLIRHAGGQVALSCIYDRALLKKESVQRFLGHLKTLLESATATPQQRIDQLPILTRTERESILGQAHPSRREYSIQGPYDFYFEQQATQRCQAIAIRANNSEISYAELNWRANQFARYLRAAGVAAERLVAVHTERTIEFAIAVLGILKAGGAYMPLDPGYPAERMTRILEDAGVHLVLTSTRLAAGMGTQFKTLCLDDPTVQDELRWHDGNSPGDASASAEDLAYVIYTSGSTGSPKGVEITHRALLNHNLAVIEAFSLTPEDRVLQFTPLSFDISIEEMLPTWLTGATVVFRNQDVLGSVSQFLEFVQRERITVANLPTAYLRALAQATWSSLPSSLRLLIVGGEAVSPDDWREVARRAGPSIRMMNAYGVTEAAITSTAFEGTIAESDRVVPIGKPLPNSTAYVVNEGMQLAPVGIAGELCIGGNSVARGYRNALELTRTRFVPDPFSAGGTLYRTGDMARLRADGNLEFLGRFDDQVKLRGFRIQLGEIEAALARHPGIAQAVVRAVAYCDLEERLVAYFVPLSGPEPGAGELIRFLQKTLPEYMIPSAFVRMESLPRTVTGKVDFRALPLPGTHRPELTELFVPPANELEEKIAAVWRDVLHIDQIGVNDNFFDLGAHSLHAMQALGRLRDLLKLEIPVSNLFEAPTVSRLASAINEGGKNVRSATSGPIARTERDSHPPLSFAQQRIWFLEQLQPGTPLYNLPQAVRLEGALNITVLERTVNEIVRRHEVLRTTYTVENEQPVQVIAPPQPCPLTIVDLSTLPAQTREAKLQETVRVEAQKPFKLDSDLMLRVVLVRNAPGDHVLLITTHHIAADGWSIEVLWKEIAALYRAFLRGGNSPLPPLPIQYADFALWKRDSLQGEILDKELAFWRKQLAGAPALLELPSDHPRPANQSCRGARHSFTIPPALTADLRALGQSEGCTLFMTLLAAFDTLLARYSGSEDIVVGTVIANRNRPELEKLVGFFANTLVLRTEVSGEPSFRDLLQRTRKVTLDAYAHQDLPFERLVEELQPARDRSFHPLFQVMLVLQNVPVRSETLPEITVTPSDIDAEISKFDLLLNLVECRDGLKGFLEYSTDLFDKPTMERLAGHFTTLLSDAVARPQTAIWSLQILTPAEKELLLVNWNAATLPVPDYPSIHALFEENAARHSEQLALVWQDQRLTYGDLNRRANQLANHLRSLGLEKQQLVGICMQRTTEMVVAMLAVLKSGSAYVPLDPDYPQDRLKTILEDARVAAVCTEKQHCALLKGVPARLILLDEERESIDVASAEQPRSNCNRNDLAYVLFTSGSTGRPKGVAIEHRSVLSLIAWTKATFAPEDLQGVLAGTSICFDLSVYEILAPLALGGTVILADNVLQVTSIPARDSVRLINTVPSAMKELIRMGGVPNSARTVNLAGEPLAQTLVDSIYDLPHVQKVFDLYGPTEATVYSTFALRERKGYSHIGRPLPNEQLYIVDKHLQPVPINVPGELLIGGNGLARGYLHQPSLTDERFIPNSFEGGQSSRLYRTGDLVKYLPNGNVEYLGRIDHQVKIRGFRIELGEIEAQLRRHPSIREAVVVADTMTSGDKRLVAYTVAREGAAVEVGELREQLKQSLPEYMVPSLFVQLPALPLTPNGKVDRKALPRPESQQPAPDERDEPRSDSELLLAQIWREVLDLPQVGIRSNFFDLGGHSLMITRILSRLKEALQIELPMKAMFEAPTIAEFALLVENAVAEQIDRLSDAEVMKLEESFAETT